MFKHTKSFFFSLWAVRKQQRQILILCVAESASESRESVLTRDTEAPPGSTTPLRLLMCLGFTSEAKTTAAGETQARFTVSRCISHTAGAAEARVTRHCDGESHLTRPGQRSTPGQSVSGCSESALVVCWLASQYFSLPTRFFCLFYGFGHVLFFL